MNNDTFSTVKPCALNPFMIAYDMANGGRAQPPVRLPLPILTKLYHAGISIAYDPGVGISNRPIDSDDNIKVIVQQYRNNVAMAVLSVTPQELEELSQELKTLAGLLRYFKAGVIKEDAKLETGEI